MVRRAQEKHSRREALGGFEPEARSCSFRERTAKLAASNTSPFFLLFFKILTMHSGSESEDDMEPEEFSDPITLSLMVPVFVSFTL